MYLCKTESYISLFMRDHIFSFFNFDKSFSLVFYCLKSIKGLISVGFFVLLIFFWRDVWIHLKGRPPLETSADLLNGFHLWTKLFMNIFKADMQQHLLF